MSLTSSRAILSTLGTAAAILSAACGSESADTSDIDSILEAAVERGEVPGVVAMATTSDGVIYQGAFGKRNVAADEDMTLNTIFRIASIEVPPVAVPLPMLDPEPSVVPGAEAS